MLFLILKMLSLRFCSLFYRRIVIKGVRKGGVGVNPPLELDILQKLYYLRKEIDCFRILFAC